MVLAERLEEWFEKRKQKQIAKAEREARAEIMALWQAWNERRVEAEKKGESFDEPPPSV